MISAATAAIEARSRSGHSVRAMPVNRLRDDRDGDKLQAMQQPGCRPGHRVRPRHKQRARGERRTAA